MADEKSGNVFDMFQKFGESLKLPTPEVDKMVEHQRKNIQAFQDAMQATSSGTQEFMSKQREQLESALADVTQMFQTFNPTEPSKMASDQMEFAKKSFETAIKNTTELGEIARDTGTESFNILRKRMEDSMSEIRESMEKKD
ncbi:MAG: TIGR01841 family phasin [Pseudomonadota bacterium]